MVPTHSRHDPHPSALSANTPARRIVAPMTARGSTNKRLRWIAAAAVWIVLAAACSPDDDGAIFPPWGEEAVAFFEGAYGAFAARDFYGVLDYYAPGAEIDMWRIDFTEGEIVDYLRIEPILSRALLDTHLGEARALALLSWPDFEARYGAVEVVMDGGTIARETVLHDIATLRRSARASPQVADFYERLFADYARAWSAGSARELAVLYADDAVVGESLTGLLLTGRDVIAAWGSDASTDWAPLSIADVDHGPEPGSGPALYLGRVRFGDDPGIAVGVFRVEDRHGCSVQTAVRWKLEGGLIADERRFPEVETFRKCSPGELPDGWWTGLGLPERRDEIVTGTIDTDGGEVAVRNGTEPLVALVRWGLERYAAAALDEPRVASITFEPTRKCDQVAGRVVDAGDSRDLFLCLHERDLCVGDEPCERVVLSARIAVLHELGHAWLLDNVDDARRERVLARSGRAVWDDTSVPWHLRGVEYAAEVMAWGLLDERIPMVRIGDPPCPELSEAFAVLTGGPPLHGECNRRRG